MTSTKKDPVLVVLQLSGGNDVLNTVVPHGDPLYYDHRPAVRVPEDQVLKIDDKVGFNPNMAPLKRIYDDGKMAVIQGVYDHFELPLPESAKRAMTAHVDANPKGKHGQHSYDLERYGLSEHKVRDRLRDYVDRFGTS